TSARGRGPRDPRPIHAAHRESTRAPPPADSPTEGSHEVHTAAGSREVPGAGSAVVRRYAGEVLGLPGRLEPVRLPVADGQDGCVRRLGDCGSAYRRVLNDDEAAAAARDRLARDLEPDGALQHEVDLFVPAR